ncbi:unnamed protein product [Onchocerca flexuosa]|uniref:Ovule protein n=1 Tax=Onchocerca flexuosa TaxID=387005 RepID=A0A183I5I7_9BILA|nr:unnamed protein product [Onchocerca flexuosa]
MSARNSSSVVNGNINIETPLKFGLSSSTLAPSFSFGKAPEINSLPTVNEEQPTVLSSHPPNATLAFGVSSGSSDTAASIIPSLTHSSFSFPTLTMTTSSATTVPSPGNTFSIPISTSVNPFTFGSSSTTTADGIKAPTASLFSFGSAAPFPAVTTNASAVTTATPLPSFGTTLPDFSASKTPLFGSSGGSQQMPVAPKPFEPPASLTSPPSTFNFGATASNGATGFVFGSTAPPTNFTFGAQQPMNNAVSTTFNFTPASSAPPFGNVPGSAPTPNFFSVGSTSSTTARKMLKARRMRK